ncbi:MAG: hypothetical protein HQL27_03685 [Candidatus Omnitrophica bacterium]|nr:hypothetical protein [Candidatus Omnitrophota bacterium]
MKKFILISAVLAFFGCSYIENPEKLIKDPHFTQYQERKDSLESRYLSKEINYSDYIQQKEALDREYEQEVNYRNEKIRE